VIFAAILRLRGRPLRLVAGQRWFGGVLCGRHCGRREHARRERRDGGGRGSGRVSSRRGCPSECGGIEVGGTLLDGN